MALIQCPKCGQKVSNTVGICVHCGQNLTQIHDIDNMEQQKSIEKKIDFNKLSIDEKTDLRNEFYKKYPKYLKAHKLNVFWSIGVKTIVYIVAFVLLCLFTLFRILAVYKIITANSPVAIIIEISIIVLLCLWIILPLISLFLKSNRRYRAMMIEKRFWKYITIEKDMNYIVMFDSKALKDKKVFEKINLDYEDI